MPPPEEGVVDVAMFEYLFVPANITITPGTTVRWTNLDQEPHDTAGQLWTSELIEPTKSYSYEFPSEALGDYYYVCTVHAGMDGTITVVVPEPTSAFAVLCGAMICTRRFRSRRWCDTRCSRASGVVRDPLHVSGRTRAGGGR